MAWHVMGEIGFDGPGRGCGVGRLPGLPPKLFTGARWGAAGAGRRGGNLSDVGGGEQRADAGACDAATPIFELQRGTLRYELVILCGFWVRFTTAGRRCFWLSSPTSCAKPGTYQSSASASTAR